ncbi:hypothetical protein HPP92_009522 [Vanilla planifolia]|uniref:Uncharacterized protein n=1 Tax=Vanilla planifolia TaxID=51239 RepID=A0A835R816_VANPL|nr:hypothetical protein HPP92_009522 [Vanilla planifolia]
MSFVCSYKDSSDFLYWIINSCANSAQLLKLFSLCSILHFPLLCIFCSLFLEQGMEAVKLMQHFLIWYQISIKNAPQLWLCLPTLPLLFIASSSSSSSHLFNILLHFHGPVTCFFGVYTTTNIPILYRP